MVAAKPFPSSIRTGIDVCHVPRIQKIIRASQESYLERWAGKVFNRLEWPSFTTQLATYKQRPEELQAIRFARWLTGRWAIKEAAIKAHSSRRLFLREISILTGTSREDNAEHVKGHPASLKPSVLIDPPTALILMDEHVARLRGLRFLRPPPTPPQLGHADQGSSLSAPLRMDDRGCSLSVVGEAADTDAAKGMHRRRGRVEIRDRRYADASLSHDGHYVVAVCQALDEGAAGTLEFIVDDGMGPPLHEPEYGDRGFEALEQDDLDSIPQAS